MHRLAAPRQPSAREMTQRHPPRRSARQPRPPAQEAPTRLLPSRGWLRDNVHTDEPDLDRPAPKDLALMATTVQAPGPAHSGSPQSPFGGERQSFGAKLRAPGFYRAAWMMVLGVAFAFGLTCLVRMTTGHTTFHHFIDGEAILTVALIAAPLM